MFLFLTSSTVLPWQARMEVACGYLLISSILADRRSASVHVISPEFRSCHGKMGGAAFVGEGSDLILPDSTANQYTFSEYGKRTLSMTRRITWHTSCYADACCGRWAYLSQAVSRIGLSFASLLELDLAHCRSVPHRLRCKTWRTRAMSPSGLSLSVSLL